MYGACSRSSYLSFPTPSSPTPSLRSLHLTLTPLHPSPPLPRTATYKRIEGSEWDTWDAWRHDHTVLNRREHDQPLFTQLLAEIHFERSVWLGSSAISSAGNSDINHVDMLGVIRHAGFAPFSRRPNWRYTDIRAIETRAAAAVLVEHAGGNAATKTGTRGGVAAKGGGAAATATAATVTTAATAATAVQAYYCQEVSWAYVAGGRAEDRVQGASGQWRARAGV